MKTFKILFSAMAFALAIGASFATKSIPVFGVQGYIQADLENCEESITCDQESGQQCTTGSGVQVYQISDGTTCSIALTRSDP
jgi:hypothetical protein